MTTLKSYMDRIKDIYRNASRRYTQVVKQIENIDKQSSEVWSDKQLNIGCKTQKHRRLQQAKDELREQLERIAAQAKADAKKVRDEAERDFDGLYTISADAIDGKTIEQLESGILTDAELIGLANQFKGNNAMRRIIGKYAGERNSKEMRALAQVCGHASDTPHLDAIDALCQACNYAVGDAPLSGIYGAACMGGRLDEMTANAYAQAPKIAWSVDGGNKHFSNQQ